MFNPVDIVNQAIEKEAANHESAASAIGLLLSISEDTIADDITGMIKQDKIFSLEGYIFSLSRTLNHKFAWRCIRKGYKNANAPIPRKFYALFGQEEEQQTRLRKHFTAT